MSNSCRPDSPPSQQQLIADAMNEQGFLFAQVVRHKIHNNLDGDDDKQLHWRVKGLEYSVTSSDGFQTRIDMVLEGQSGVHLAVECKRANPLYKQWVFFDPADGSGSRDQSLFLETWSQKQRTVESQSNVEHTVKQLPVWSPCHVYQSYLEAKVIPKEKRASATNTIEDAFQQVIRGHSGLMAKLIGFKGSSARSIPVVVTTADLFAVEFDHNRVSLKHGNLNPEDLTLKPLPFCAINYHVDDRLALEQENNSFRRVDIEHDLRFFQTRSILVVQSESINKFLRWAHQRLTDN